jgi:hypothetical protein
VTSQLSLLDPTFVLPGRVHRDDPATSRTAAARIAIKAGALKHRVMLALRDAGEEGMNDYELWRACDPSGRVHSAATRRGELEALGLVVRTGRTRPTDTPGCEGTVHVLTDEGRRVLAGIETTKGTC